MVDLQLTREQAERLARLLKWTMVACHMGPEEETELIEIIEKLRPLQAISPEDVSHAK